MNIFLKKQHPVCGFAFSAIFVEQASNKSQLGRRYPNPNLVHRNAWLDNSRYYIFVRCNGAYQTNPIHQANVAYKYSWYVYVFLVALYPCVYIVFLAAILSYTNILHVYCRLNAMENAKMTKEIIIYHFYG